MSHPPHWRPQLQSLESLHVRVLMASTYLLCCMDEINCLSICSYICLIHLFFIVFSLPGKAESTSSHSGSSSTRLAIRLLIRQSSLWVPLEGFPICGFKPDGRGYLFCITEANSITAQACALLFNVCVGSRRQRAICQSPSPVLVHSVRVPGPGAVRICARGSGERWEFAGRDVYGGQVETWVRSEVGRDEEYCQGMD